MGLRPISHALGVVTQCGPLEGAHTGLLLRYKGWALWAQPVTGQVAIQGHLTLVLDYNLF